jgi:hypothetical protein
MAIPVDRHFCIHPVGAADGCYLLLFKRQYKKIAACGGSYTGRCLAYKKGDPEGSPFYFT